MKYFFTILFTLFFLGAFSQTSTISGQVVSDDGITLPGALIEIEDTNFSVIADENGHYRIAGLTDGDYQLSVKYIGFQPTSAKVQLSGALTQNFTLTAGVELADIIVVGQSLQGIARALNQQKNNTNITNVVSADQIGRFPDANIGDAMKRIPGITMQNDQGEARNIFIRGIAPQYNSVTLNGDRIPSAEGDNRNIQMDLIPADMIQLIQVNKAITPEMDADAIGGSVNLVTRSATSDPRISATFAPGYSPIRDAPNWTGGLIAGNRFLEDKLGVVFSGSYNYKDYGSDNFEAEYDGNNLDEFQLRRYDVIRQRIAGGLDVDYRFNPNNTIRFKTLLSDRKDWENRYRVVYADIEENGDFYTVERQTKAGTPDIKDRRLEQQKVNKFGLDGEHVFGKIQLDWSGSYSEASEDRPNERYIQYNAERDEDTDAPFAGTIVGLGTEDLNIIENELISASDFELDELTEEFQFTEEQNWKGQFKFTIPVMTGSANNSELKLGYTYKQKDKIRDNGFREYTDSFEDAIGTLADLPTSDQTPEGFNPGDSYDFGDLVNEEFLGGLDLANAEGEDVLDEFIPVNYEAEENVNAGFIQYNQNLGERWSFIAGARFEATSLDYNGFELEGDAISPTTGSSDYENFLPSFHTNFRPNNNAVLRFAWTNSLARPNYYDLVPYLFIDDGEAELGNPDLKAAEAMNFDLMGEYYFEEIGLVSLGGFYKNIDDFFFNFTDDNDPVVGTRIFDEITQPRNGEEANVYGFEASFQRQLDFFGDFFGRFNLYTNYTYTDSEATIAEREGEDLTLAGTAPHLFNASLAYEDKKFTTRLSFNHSSDYVDEYGGEANEDIYYDKQSFLDFNANYFLKGQWTIFAEAKNLTNQPLRYYQGAGFEDRTFQIEFYEPNYNLGVKFDF
ncbi:MAG: TonB-dependent receptor [Saprospiraceae bacterium]|nr:TonB-dependent receptor [Saprospiraceae bacterium]